MDTGVDRRTVRWQDEVDTWGRRVGVPALGAIVALTALTTLAGWLVVHGGGGALDRVDVDAARDLAASRTSTLDALTSAVDLLASTVTVAVLWLAAVVVTAWRTRAPAVPIFLVAAIGGEKLTYLLGSTLVDRPRPPVARLGHTFSTSSFPSGHVGAAITLYGGIAVAALWLDRRRHGTRPVGVRIVAGVVVAAVGAGVAFARCYRGHHHPTDVVWGALLGVVWLALAHRLALRGET